MKKVTRFKPLCGCVADYEWDTENPSVVTYAGRRKKCADESAEHEEFFRDMYKKRARA